MVIVQKEIKLILMFILALVSIIIIGCHKSNYSHCVIVDKSEYFNGSWLKNTNHVLDETLSIQECQQKDEVLDGSDGPKTGKVRWATCYSGPDCNEAGAF